MNIGTWNTLKIDRFTAPGAFLTDEHGDDVLLPNKYVRDEYVVGDEISVFLYKDSEDRLVATTRIPLIEINKFAYLKVLEVNVHGAFLDWGLEKDLLVPFKEQPRDMEEGKSYLVYLYLDDATQRLAATARVAPYIVPLTNELETQQQVDLLVCERTDLGVKVIINDQFRGLIFHSDIHRKLHLGERTTGYIKQIREDGKADITLHPEGYDKVEPLTKKLMQLLYEHDGFLQLTDKSDPETIRQLTGWSKKTFKQVVGNLYKQRLILLHENGISLIEE